MKVSSAAALALVLASCASAPPAEFPAPERVRMTLSQGAARLVVDAEVARTPTQKRRGLMGRTEVPPGTGMVFVWDDVAPRSFWMRDTLVALDLFVIRQGRVVEVLTLQPCRVERCPTTPTEAADRVLEVRAGTARSSGIGVDALVEAPPLG